jgi:hypothetical protein
MSFKDKFKIGDIICSDSFHAGLCMIVEKYNTDSYFGEKYICQDLVRDGQKWAAYAYEFDNMFFKRTYDWRIATDDDIVNYLTRFVDISFGKVGQFYNAKLTDTGIVLEDLMFTDRDVNLDVEELIDLKRIIEERLEQ